MKKIIALTLMTLFSSSILASGIGIDKSALASSALELYHESSLYDEIADYFNQNQDAIAQRQLSIIDHGRNLRTFGGLNNVGLSFTKGFADFSIELRRDVAPDLFDSERWLVTDTFNLYLDAGHVLGKLAKADVIEMTEESLALFAGITFKREFQHVHFAANYQEAISFNLNKLFSSFLKFRSKNYLAIAPGEYLKKEDSISLQAGGLASAPLTSGLSARVGALIKYKKMKTTSIQGILTEDASYEGEALRISTEKSSLVNIGASAQLIAQFLGVLRATILSVDFDYSLEDISKTYLTFSHSNVELLKEDTQIAREVENILGHRRSDLQVLTPFIVSEERRRIENKSLRYGVVFFGGQKEAQTSHIQLIADQKQKSFFRHNFLRTKFREYYPSRLFSILVRSFFKVPTFVSKTETETDNVRIEYEAQRNLIISQEDLKFSENEERLSLNFVKEYQTYRYTQKTAKKVQDLLEEYSGSNPLIAAKLRDGELKAPISFQTNFSFGHNALTHFHKLSTSKVYEVIDNICYSSRKVGFFSFFLNLFSNCKGRMKRNYDAYLVEWKVNDYEAATYDKCAQTYKASAQAQGPRREVLFMKLCMQKLAKKTIAQRDVELPLWRFKNFAHLLSTRIKSKVHFYDLFGHKNVHVHGEFSAIDTNGDEFINYFREGVFSGTGLIQNTLKNEGLRSPASTNYL